MGSTGARPWQSQRFAPTDKHFRLRVLDDPRYAEDPEELAAEPAPGPARPRTLGECDAQRLGTPAPLLGPANHVPCPYVSCSYHLYLDVSETGSITINFPHLAPWELASTCALRVAAHGEQTLEQIGDQLNLTRERARQIETGVRRRLRGLLRTELGLDIDELLADDVGGPPGRSLP